MSQHGQNLTCFLPRSSIFGWSFLTTDAISYWYGDYFAKETKNIHAMLPWQHVMLYNKWLDSGLHYMFLFQEQLSAVEEEESNAIAGSEVEALKQTIADKDREIAELSGQLQTLQAQLQTVGKYPSEEEEVYRLMVETSELTAKLVEAEG